MGDIRSWLTTLGLEKYIPAFEQNDVDLDVLPELSELDLAELGVSLGHRKKIIGAVRNARHGHRKSDFGNDVPDPVHLPFEDPETGERRIATVLFSDIADSTYLSNVMDAEDYGDLIAKYQTTASDAVSAFGGHVAKYLGDGLLAYFGVPSAHEDDATRAIEAGDLIARRVDRRFRGHDPAVSVRVGIATGPVVTGPSSLSGRDATFGPTINLASRIQGVAPPGGMTIDATTKTLVGSRFRVSEFGEHDLKGFPDPVPLWVVEGRNRRPTRFEAATGGKLGPHLGRSHEINLLSACWEGAKSGHGQVIVVTAPPGVGKSRLVHEFVNATDSAEALFGQCHSFGQSKPFLPFIDMLSRLICEGDVSDEHSLTELLNAFCEGDAAELGDVKPYLAELLGLSSGDTTANHGSPEELRAQTFRALTKALVETAPDEGRILCLEDVHWIDQTSEDYLLELIEAIRDRPILLVATARPTARMRWPGVAHFTHVSLTPLDRENSRALLRWHLSRTVPDDENLARFVERTEGNPFFIEQLSHLVAAEPRDEDIPETLQNLLMSQIDRLPRRERAILEVASVLGREFQQSFIRGLLTDVPDVDDSLARLKQHDFIFERPGKEDSTYVFRHALIQDVAYKSLLRSKRSRLHADIAAALAAKPGSRSNDRLHLLAHHYERAGAVAESIEARIKLSDVALQTYSVKDAHENLSNALSQISRSPEIDLGEQETGVRFRLSRCLYLLGRFEDSIAVLEPVTQSQSIEPSAALLGESCFWMSHMLTRVARYDDALTVAERALGIATAAGQKNVEGKTNGLLCFWHLAKGDLDESRRLGGLSIEALETCGDALWLGMSHFYRGMTEMQGGRFDRAIAFGDRVIEIGAELGEPRLESYGLFLRGWSLANAGEHGIAVDACQQAQDLAPDPTCKIYASMCLGYALAEQGSLSEGIELLQDANEGLRVIGFRPFTSLFQGYLAEALVAAGSLDEATQVAKDGLEANKNSPYALGAGWTARAHGKVLCAIEDDSGKSALEKSVSLFETAGAHFEVGRTHLDFARLYRKQRNDELAEDHQKLAKAAFAQTDRPRYDPALYKLGL